MRTDPLGQEARFGLVVRGVTLDDVQSEPVRRELRRLWTDAGLLVFRDLEVTHELHIELSRVFGELVIHPNPTQLVDGRPELARVQHNADEMLVEVDGERLGGYVAWHRDLAYVADMSRGAMLRGVILSEHGGETGFIDLIAAYERLPEMLRRRIDGYEVAYDQSVGFPFAPHVKVVREGRDHRGFKQRREAGGFPLVAHPLVRPQDGTGRKILSLSPLAASFIIGLDRAESNALLAELVGYATDETHAHFHKWTDTNTLLLWDNWRLLHCATGVPEHETRVMYRTTIAGDRALGRVIDAEVLVRDRA